MTTEKLEEVVLISPVFYKGKNIIGEQELPESLVAELKAMKNSPVQSERETQDTTSKDDLGATVPVEDYDAALEKLHDEIEAHKKSQAKVITLEELVDKNAKTLIELNEAQVKSNKALAKAVQTIAELEKSAKHEETTPANKSTASKNKP